MHMHIYLPINFHFISKLQVGSVTEADKACVHHFFNHLKEHYPTCKVNSCFLLTVSYILE